MNVLEDSPLQALAFHHLSFDFFNNLWTWLAVIFWRIRTPNPELLPPSSQDDTVSELLEPCNDDDNVLSRVHSTVVCDGDVNDVDGVTKGKMKFTSYYNEDDVIDGKCNETLHLTVELWEDREERLEWWEKLLKTRTGENENGWYTCQDLTALNGNVVRFWEESSNSFSYVSLW
ncbi:uncharacterized protein LOC131601901 [Vicia villosa]|uniref:uncharacterized protein LOC131601901 n=1 Tax=Vicia villosa TaxID=3911 RepID=UPI00273AE327|nr:uncharacterized protein LOC131601901 [Vicia villosa]